MKFKEINADKLELSATDLFANQWTLITAGNDKQFNTMTAAWGGIGSLWFKPVTYIFIRPQRYTFQFTEKYDYFSLCFFDGEYRHILEYCGANSGKDVDKIKETGLTPFSYKNKAIYFEQARIVLICKKLYYNDIDPNHFHEKEIIKLYPNSDYHRMYIGEIEKCFIRETE